MRVATCQYDVKKSKPLDNIQTIKTMLKGIKADLIVLPELALTGYFFENSASLKALTKSIDKLKVIETLQNIAREVQSTIVVGLSELDNDKLYNTAYVIDQSGVIGKHRKIHLTRNEKIFDAGDTVDIINVNGINIGIAICFETWFPEFFRTLAARGADMVVCPSNFGGPYTHDVARVRALENSLPVVLTNRVGSELMYGEIEPFCGGSRIIDAYGTIIHASDDQAGIYVTDIDCLTPTRNKNLICDEMDKERAKYNGM